MTTTNFKSKFGTANIAGDSRVSFIDPKTKKIVGWQDCDNFYKAFTLDGVTYGFAGTNGCLSWFYRNYTSKDTLNDLVTLAKSQKVTFYILAYENKELRLYHHDNGKFTDDSVGNVIKSKSYGIGSGASSSVFLKNQAVSATANRPIDAIIKLNEQATKGKAESEHEQLCLLAGSDNGTGGKVKMATTITIQDQLHVLASIKNKSDSMNAVAFCNIDSEQEQEKMQSAGVEPKAVDSDEANEQANKLQEKYQDTELA
ncbi:hypothetical protein [Vibrio splendidus]|uniref:hypothetical protein n=1 Tax=Vibrio splendidus TaxID=29497 RepID=UPI002468B8BB|nr:hypothetical protein [Vibrio splendidus]MDH6017995.1 hypothetical protein [Vibrio splendidus]